jgi:hypothetical protein
MTERCRVSIGGRVRIDGVGYERLFRDREGTFLGFTRAGWARVRIDDASPWESALSTEHDTATGLPVILVGLESLRAEEVTRE